MRRFGVIIGGIAILVAAGIFLVLALSSFPAPKTPIEKQIPNEKLAK